MQLEMAAYRQQFVAELKNVLRTLIVARWLEVRVLLGQNVKTVIVFVALQILVAMYHAQIK